jgi:protein-arginine kinase activator protein McsA
MNRINNYNIFLIESNNDRIKSCTDGILYFLKDNNINDWNEFVNMSQFKRDVINKMIDKQVKDMKELGEVRFNLKLELSDVEQLREYLKELEKNEEYEKCAKVLKKISK